MTEVINKYRYVIAYHEQNKTTLFLDTNEGKKGEDDISTFIPFPDSSKKTFEMLYPHLNWINIKVGYKYWMDNKCMRTYDSRPCHFIWIEVVDGVVTGVRF